MRQFDGGRLAEYRIRANLKQSQVAHILDTTQQSVARWEKGRSEPTIGQLCTLADHYGASLDELLGRTVPEHPSAEFKETTPPTDDDSGVHISKADLPKIAKAVRKLETAAEVLSTLLRTPSS